MERWWDENIVVAEQLALRLCAETVHIYDDDDRDIASVQHSFVGIDRAGIFAGYAVTLTTGQKVFLYADGRVCDEDDNEIGKHYLYAWKSPR